MPPYFLPLGGAPAQREERPVKRDCWPDGWEELLLQAALVPLPRALQAWRDFCAGTPEEMLLDHLRLVPLIAVRLGRLEEEVPRRAFLQSSLRESWLRTQHLFHLGLPALHRLDELGIEFLVLKGAALAQQNYPQPGARPMADIDLLVHPADVRPVAAALAAAGWAAVKQVGEDEWPDHLRFRHELTFHPESGPDLDVHWHLTNEARHPDVERLLWRDAVPLALPGLKARTLQPADQLLHTCIHGVHWNKVSAVRWLADAALLAAAQPDWTRLKAQAQKLELIEPVRDTLLCLHRLGVELPTEVVARWQDLTSTRREKWEHAYRARREEAVDRTRHLALAYLRIQLGRRRGFALWREVLPYMRQIHHFRSPFRRLKFFGFLLFYRLVNL